MTTIQISPDVQEKSLNYSTRIKTNAEQWDVSPNKHPKYKPGIQLIAEQLLLGRKLPKKLVVAPDSKVDAAFAGYMYTKPQAAESPEFMNLLKACSYVMQYGCFAGDELSDSLIGQSETNVYRTIEMEFEQNLSRDSLNMALQKAIERIDEACNSPLEFSVTEVEQAETSLLYKHGGLAIVDVTKKGNDRFRQFSDLVKENKLVVVRESLPNQEQFERENYEYTFLRKSRSVVPPFYNKLKQLKLSSGDIVINDPTGIVVAISDLTHSEISHVFQSI